MPVAPAIPDVLRDARPWRFDAALRLVALANPGLPPLGTSAQVGEDAVRITQAPDLAFPTSELTSLSDGPRAPRLGQALIGLLGPNGPMPLAFSEHMLERAVHAGDLAPQRFLDVFHHRLASLFHRAWAARAPESAHDRPGEDWFTTQLLALGGGSCRTEHLVADGERAALAGLLLARPRGVAGLAAMLRLVLRAPVEVDGFQPSWVPLDPADRCRIGQRAVSSRLGSAVLGRRLHSRIDAIRVRIGPLDAAAFARLAPGSDGFLRLRCALRTWLTRPLEVEVRWVLDAASVPRVRLGASRLGRDSWMRLRPDARSADQLRVVVPSHGPHLVDRPLSQRVPVPPATVSPVEDDDEVVVLDDENL